MAKKKKKRSAEDFVNSVVDELTSASASDLFDALSQPTKAAERVSGAILGSGDFSVEPTKTATEYFEENQGMPEGLENKTAIMTGHQVPQEVKFESGSSAATATAILPVNQEPQYEPLSYSSSSAKSATSSVVNAKSTSEYQSDFSNAENQSEKTVVVGVNRVHGHDQNANDEKVSYGVAKPSTRSIGSSNAFSTDAQLMQAENLRIAQQRLNDLEQELEKLRAENEQLFSTNEVGREKTTELGRQVEKLEREKAKQADQFNSEICILKDNYASKDSEIKKLREKVDELEGRLRQDLRKVRVRERELENRLELVKMEKDALLRSKDESILELRRKVDQLSHELDAYRHRVSDLNNQIENNHEQLSRTVRALRLALTNLEVNEDGAGLTIAPFKKAE